MRLFRTRIMTLLTAWSLLIATSAAASNFTMRFGPPNLGTGGSNPIGIPPSILDVELTYVSQAGFETNLSVSPGLLFGYRNITKSGLYTSLGGGLVLSANGTGLGGYAAFGVDMFCGFMCFNAEFKQAVAVGPGYLLSPYALRIGGSVWF